ncbi:hypothetical protein P154DRAFT_192319 [Amniculicola lignicola CBS 123094]|uniref:F-box domain-containing protein n=1 Tax=Amniculicola lignicola CBS 123094 TaxID=1392246 RepID=A0A6A5WFH5_9PLEO|nr:hypothetical protein P154DRAFT_192319 [Amniculicola lignicola CBS 123094]
MTTQSTGNMDETAARHPPILRLPQELVQTILDYLDPADLPSFRSTCRALEVSSFAAFADEFFSTIKYDFSAYDTEYLSELSKQTHFLSRVKTLRICSTRCTRLLDAPHFSGQKPWGFGYSWTREPYRSLTGNHAAVDALSSLLKERFVNCRNFTIVNDGAHSSANLFSELQLTGNDALAALLYVFQRAEIQPASLHMLFGRLYNDTLGGRLDPARLRPFLISAVAPLGLVRTEGLTSLTVDAGFGIRLVPDMAIVRSMYGPIKCARNLQHVRLCFRSQPQAATALLELFQPSESILPKLRLFELTYAILSENVLADFLLLIKASLTSLALQQVALRTGAWETLLVHIAEALSSLGDVWIRYLQRPSEVFGQNGSTTLAADGVACKGKNVKSRLLDAARSAPGCTT